MFIDDILVYNTDPNLHVQHLRVTLHLLKQNHLVINLKKCVFAKGQLEYLGHIISRDGVLADPWKIESMVKWPVPTSLKSLRGFLGLIGYYCRFIRHYGIIAAPVTALLRKDAFCLSQEAQEAFEKLKAAMASAPVLALPNFDQPFIVESEASESSLGAVLMQEERPLAYFSQSLSNRKRLCSVYEHELIAIVFAVRKW